MFKVFQKGLHIMKKNFCKSIVVAFSVSLVACGSGTTVSNSSLQAQPGYTVVVTQDLATGIQRVFSSNGTIGFEIGGLESGVAINSFQCGIAPSNLCGYATNQGLYVTGNLVNTTNVSSSNIPLANLAIAESQIVGVGESGVIEVASNIQLNESGVVESWIPTVVFAGSENLNSVDNYYLQGTYIAVGNAGSIYQSVDGINWNNKVSNTTANLYSLDFVDNESGTIIIVGESGTVILSTDKGNSYTLESSISANDLYAVANDEKNNFYVGGSSKTMFKSNDGGLNWAPIALPAYPDSNGVVNYAVTGISYSLGSATANNSIGFPYQATVESAPGVHNIWMLVSKDGESWAFESMAALSNSQTSNLSPQIFVVDDIVLVITSITTIVTTTTLLVIAWDKLNVALVNGLKSFKDLVITFRDIVNTVKS